MRRAVGPISTGVPQVAADGPKSDRLLRDWTLDPAQDTVPKVVADRRLEQERRTRFWWAILYGNFRPRRRRPWRRVDESRFQVLDWHPAHLLAVALGILLLSFADACMTVTLLAGGAVEVNPVMAMVIAMGVGVFAAAKMTLTGLGVILMVSVAHYRFMRAVRVDVVMYVLLACYLVLLTYEFQMLRSLISSGDL